MHRLLILVALAALALPSCGDSQKRKPIAPSRNTNKPNAQKPSGPNWAAMFKKVRNVPARTEKIIQLMSDAVSEHDHYKRSVKAGSEDKARLKKAQDLKIEAGGLYDELQMDVFDAAGNDDLGQRLWDKRLANFQARYDRHARKIRRIEFK